MKSVAVASVAVVGVVDYVQEPDLRLTAQWASEFVLVALVAGYARRILGEADRQQSLALDRLGRLADAWDHPTRPTVVGSSPEHVHGARMALADTVRIVLRNGLARLGAAAPERM